LWTDRRFISPQLRATHRRELTDLLNSSLRRRTTAEWIEVLHRQHIPCGPILDLQQVFADPQVRHNGMVREHDHPTAGPRQLLGFPLQLSEAAAAIHLPAPALGERTEAILSALGYSQGDIEELRRTNVL
jgi:crotonobetainyl-CoA:carnitine CoA-transferase CaiB-like acyl-CoA transferase